MVIDIDDKKDNTSEPSAEEIAQDLVNDIQKMVKDRDAKCDAAKTQLIESLKVTADKYRTATGAMEALRVMRMVNDGRLDDMQIFDEIEQARDLATAMVNEVSVLTKKATDLGWAEMNQLCKGAYDEDFISSGFSANDLAFELMRLDLCRNVGPAAEDMVEFYKRANEEIAKSEEKYEDMCKENAELKKLKPEV